MTGYGLSAVGRSPHPFKTVNSLCSRWASKGIESQVTEGKTSE